MRKILIPVLNILLCASYLIAQEPVSMQISGKLAQSNGAEMCNDAGTYQFSTFIGQSNDITPDTLFLCHLDSLFINHNGNATFVGDPVAATAPGVVYGFYTCPPSIMGPDLTTVLGDCFWMNATTMLPNIAAGNPSGDIWFRNTGSLLNTPNQNGVQYWFAPMTIDDFGARVYENGGPCVHVNTNDAFSVVYLPEITVSNPTIDNCLGKFKIFGGLPAFDITKNYTVNFYKSGNPNIKGIFRTNSFKHNTVIEFSVNEPGTYILEIEDGKSCGAVAQFDMNPCDITGALAYSVPDTVAETGTQICVPIVVSNFNSSQVITTSFSANWDPTILQYVSATSTLPGFNPVSDLIATQSGQGNLGFAYSNPNPVGAIALNDGSAILNICFNVIGPIGSSTDVTFSGTPTKANTYNEQFIEILNIFNAGNVLVVDPGNVSVSTAVTLDGCTGSGSIKLTATGGPSPYTINWNPGGGTGNISALGGSFTTPILPGGAYTFTITDATAATATATVNIPLASLGANLVVVSQPLCRNDKNGTIRVDISQNGTIVNNPGSQFSYAWSPSNVPNPSGNIQNGIGASNYTVTVTDNASGCTVIAQGSLSQPPLLERSGPSTITNTSCAGVNDGALTFLATGGTPTTTGNYTFNWTYAPTVTGTFTTFSSNVQTNPSSLTNLATGVYRVTVSDVNGCSFTDQVTIGTAKNITLTAAGITNPTCFGGTNGSVQINVTTVPNTPGVYSYVWSPMPVGSTTTNVAMSSTLNNIGAGSYILVATENGTGCSARDTFLVTQPDSIKFGVNKTNPTCPAPFGGNISLTNVMGGTGGSSFNYAWNTPNGSGGQANNLAAGTYTVTISDAALCTKVYTTTLVIPSPPSVTFDSTAVKCGLDGCVEAIGTPQPGSTILSYLWADQATGTIIGTTSKVCNLNGGNYIVTVTSNDGCSVIDTMTLFQPNISVIDTVTYILPSCFGAADGIVSVGMQGSFGPYTYTWSIPAPSVPSLVGVEAGIYTVTIMDTKNCTVVAQTELKDPPRILVNYPTITPATCNGLCTGIAIPAVSYNTVPPTTANFNFSWESGETDSIANQLCAGINRVTISDPGSNCFVIDSVIISQPTSMVLNAEIKPPTCAGYSDGQAELSAAGSNGGPFIYDWGFTTLNPAINLAADTFPVTVTDATGCVDTFAIIVDEPNPVLVAVDFGTTTDVICNNDQNGVAAVLITGGNPGGFIYAWSGGVSTAAVATDLAPGLYFVTVTDSNGCTGESDSIVIQNPPTVTGSYLPWTELICAGDQTTFEIDTIEGGNGGPYQFTIDYGVELPLDFPVSITGGQHIITYLDRFGCNSEDTINVNPGINLQVDFGQPTVTVELGDTLYLLSPNISGGTIDDFTWTPADKVSDPTSLTPFANTFVSTTYTLLVTDPNGCTGEGSIFVKIDPNRNVYIPNALAPNAKSGLNTHWKVFTGLGIEQVNFARVYDRWGDMVYEKVNYKANNDDYSEGWDGTFRDRGLNPGVYVYLVEVTFLDGRVLLYRGDISLVK
jgi:CHU_C Type IX secretion signal domain/SprB repeat